MSMPAPHFAISPASPQGNAKIHITRCPTKGGASLAQRPDGVGHIPISFTISPRRSARSRPGTVLPLAVTTTAFVVTPNVPTVRESGLQRIRSGVWVGRVGPAGLPRDIRSGLFQAAPSDEDSGGDGAFSRTLGATADSEAGPATSPNSSAADYDKWGGDQSRRHRSGINP